MVPKYSKNIVAGNLRAHRAKQRLTQEQLADMADVSVQSVKNWENAQSVMNFDNAVSLANVLKIELHEFLI